MTVFNAPDFQSTVLGEKRTHIKSSSNTASSGVSINVLNLVWDPGGPDWVVWSSQNTPDTTGVLYPDPYGTGFAGCSGYREIGRG